VGNETHQQEISREEFIAWAESIKPNALSIWRETGLTLRQIQVEFWSNVRLILTLNGVIIAAIITLLLDEYTSNIDHSIRFLIGLGVLLTFLVFFMLRKHRGSYLAVLAQKVLIEEKLGFYKIILNKDMSQVVTLLASEWQVPKEHLEDTLKPNLSDWVRPLGRITATTGVWVILGTVILTYIVLFLSLIYFSSTNSETPLQDTHYYF